MNNARLDRRDFIRRTGASLAVLATGLPGHLLANESKDVKFPKLTLGFDNFSIRSMGWNATQLIDYAAGLGVETLLMSDLNVYESYEVDYLAGIKKQADAKGIKLHVGTGSICPTSKTFNEKWGNAQQHLELLIRVAKALGSPVARCYVGNGGDRETEGGIQRHHEATARACQSVRSQAIDAGVVIAIENHAGDSQGWEVARLIEAAGKDYVGATMDSGNSIWALETPMQTLEALGPYAVTTGIRDDAVWLDENGVIQTQWTAMGEGHVDWVSYFNRYMELCPKVPVQLEIICGGPRGFDIHKDEFWNAWPELSASRFSEFLQMAQAGKPFVTPEKPKGIDGKETGQLEQKFDLERSIAYCRDVLGMSAK